VTTPLSTTMIGAVYPLAGGAAQFNGALVRAMARSGPVDVISWRRLYPPLLYRGQETDSSSPVAVGADVEFMLDWHDPRTWRRAARRIDDLQPDVVVLPWLHPVQAPPYRYLLRHVPRKTARVVICHNVVPHEPKPGMRLLSRAALQHADLLVIHAPQQRTELAELGLDSTPILETFHPRFEAQWLAPAPAADERAAERARQGNPDLLLLTFGAIRPYKGVDLALNALARVDKALRVRLVVAGRSWGGIEQLRAQAVKLGLNGRLEIRERFIPNDEAALLFSAADASLLPYRSASQSGVVQLSFAYDCPVIATRVGGLPEAVEDGVDGILCDPDPDGLAAAIERMALDRARLAAGVRARVDACSFDEYGRRLLQAVEELPR
jgi:glycosyltransferase involved in cell wall biosynthesis